MEIGKIIQRVRSRFAGGVQSTSFRLKRRHVYSMMVSGREILLSQIVKKKQTLSSWNYQTLPFVEMERVKEEECEALGIRGCTVLKSKHKIPPIMMGFTSYIISEVSSSDRMVKYDEMSNSSVKYSSGSRFAKSFSGYFFKDGKIYMTHTRGPKSLSITGVFVDPLEAYNFPSSCGDSDTCVSNVDRDFHFDKKLVPTLVNLIRAELSGDSPEGSAPRQREVSQGESQ